MAIDPLTGLPTTSSSTISTASMQPTTPTVIPPVPTVPPTIYTSAISQTASDLAIATENTKQKQSNVDTANKGYANISDILAGEQAGNVKDIAGTYQQQGVNTLYNQLQDLNAQATGLKNEASAIPIQLQQSAANTGATDRGLAPIQTQQLRDNALKSLSLGTQYAIAEGNYNKAKNYADQLIETKYATEEARIKGLQTQQASFDKTVLTPAEQKRLEAVTKQTNLEAQQLADRKQEEKDTQALAMTVSKNLASFGVTPEKSQKVVSSILNAKSFNDRVIASAPYLQSASDKADVSYKLAQTAKLYADIKKDAMTAGSNLDPSQSLAYAQEYASTGKIPTGIPKGGFGKVSAWAKELPKQNGEIVSTATGVHPSQDSTYADALSSLSSVVKLAQDLKTQDKSRIGGVVGGTLGLVTGSKAQGDYISTRGQIIDLLSRARSGAALTENEVKTYEDMLPGRFSEPLGLGQNSDVKIQQFVDAITKDMQNKANAKGWSIYGVSKVKPQGSDSEYTVGDIISVNGQTGRVNSDGSITLIQ